MVRTGILGVMLLWCGGWIWAQLLDEGFENTATGEITDWEHIEGWRIDDWDGADADFSIVDDTVNSGSKSLKIDVLVASGTRPDQIYLANWAYPVTVPAGKVLEISFYARGTEEEQKIGLDLKHPDAWNNLLSQEFSISTSFEKYSLQYNVYTQQELGIYMNFAFGTGVSYWIDDIGFDTLDISETPEIDPEIRLSDIGMTSTSSPYVYDRFHTSLIGWGWLPRPLTQEKIELWRAAVMNVHGEGIKYQARFEVDAGWKNMLDYDPDGYEDDIIITLDSTRLLIPWFSDRTHNGIPAYYFCTNSGGFRKFLRYQVETAVSGEPESLLFDGQTCTPLAVKYYGGCFCEFCLAGFRSYLDENYSSPELLEKGIEDISVFNYRSHLKENGWTESAYIAQNWKSTPVYPLSNDWLKYQNLSTRELSSDLSRYADSLAGKHIHFSTSSPPSEPFRSVIIPEVDMYTEELSQGGNTGRFSTGPVFTYKFIESLKKKILLTGSPQNDWSPLADYDRPALVRLWIAQAYAHGALFMVPLNQWAPLSPSGWYNPNYGEFDYIYEFISSNASLFDNYSIQAKSSFLLPYKGLRNSKARTSLTVRFLVDNNIPFKIVAAGDDWWPGELEEENFINADAILVNNDTSYLNYNQSQLLHAYRDKVVGYNDLDGLFQRVPQQFDVSVGNGKISVVPRENLIDPEAPYICHLINRQYAHEANLILPQDFSLTVDTSFFDKQIGGATFFRPGMEELELELFSAENGFRVDIDNLEEWGIIRFEFGEPEYTSIETPSAESDILVYPNPAADFIYVDVEKPSEIGLFDINGVSYISRIARQGLCRISLESLPSGIYILRVNSGDEVFMRKVIISH